MSPTILIAGIGNVFFGDDGFGVEVARRLSREPLPRGVRVLDFGIRGLHLAYELLAPIDLVVVADAVSRDGEPGTIYVIEPELDGDPDPEDPGPHGMDLRAVFTTVERMGGALPKVRIVGCEPAELDERLGLSPVVEDAVETAAETILRLVHGELGDSKEERDS